MTDPASAPTSVMRFQNRNTAIPVCQKPSRDAAGSGWASPTALDSSMVSWAAAAWRAGWRRPSSGARKWRVLSAYRPLRMLSMVAVAIAAGAAASPPAPTMPTKANWDPPVNISAERAWVCQMLRPAATESAPKLTP